MDEFHNSNLVYSFKALERTSYSWIVNDIFYRWIVNDLMVTLVYELLTLTDMCELFKGDSADIYSDLFSWLNNPFYLRCYMAYKLNFVALFVWKIPEKDIVNILSGIS
jgi:hypothetical protein